MSWEQGGRKEKEGGRRRGELRLPSRFRVFAEGEAAPIFMQTFSRSRIHVLPKFSPFTSWYTASLSGLEKKREAEGSKSAKLSSTLPS